MLRLIAPYLLPLDWTTVENGRLPVAFIKPSPTGGPSTADTSIDRLTPSDLKRLPLRGTTPDIHAFSTLHAAAMTDYATLLREALRRGNPIDVVVTALRAQGASLVESVKAVHDVMGVSLTENKRIVDDAADTFKPDR